MLEENGVWPAHEHQTVRWQMSGGGTRRWPYGPGDRSVAAASDRGPGSADVQSYDSGGGGCRLCRFSLGFGCGPPTRWSGLFPLRTESVSSSRIERVNATRHAVAQKRSPVEVTDGRWGNPRLGNDHHDHDHL